MATLKVRHMVTRRGGYYFQATAAMRGAGLASEPLGRDLAAAIARAEQLNALWDEIRAGQKAAAQRRAPAPGSLDWLAAELRASGEWQDKAPRTREDIERAFKVILPVFGPARAAAVQPAQVARFYEKLRARGRPHETAMVMKWFRYLFSFGLRLYPRLVPHNPTLAVRVHQPRARRQYWQPEQVRRAIRQAWRWRWYGVAAAIALAYDTGLRPQDLRALTPRQLLADRVVLAPQKTDHLPGRDQPRAFPVWPETFALVQKYLARLGAIIPADQPLLRSVSGRPFTSRHHLAKQIRLVRRAAGLPDDLQLRDLRRTGNVEAALGGASAPQLAARADHSIGRGQAILDVYTPATFEAAKAAQEARRRRKPE